MKLSHKSLFSFVLVFFLLISGFLFLLPSPSGQVGAVSEQAKNRRKVAALGYCLTESVATSEGTYQDFFDAFDGNGDYQRAAVGLDIDQTDSLWTCKQTVEEAGAILDAAGLLSGDADDNIQTKVEISIFGQPFANFGDTGADGGDARNQMRDFAENVIAPYVDSIPITDQEIAERLLPLADICYFFSDLPINGEEFTFTGSDGRQVWADKANLNGGRVVVERLGGSKNDGFDLSNPEIGDIDMQWDTDNFGHNSDWYPFGHDLYDFATGNPRGNFLGTEYSWFNSLVDCDAVKNNISRLSGEYRLNDAGDELVLSDGTTAEQIVDEGEIDFAISLGGDDVNPTCESAGTSLSWLFCPIINGALDSMDWMFRQFIEPFLITQPLTTNDGDYTYEVWKGFRTIGNILLIFTLLFIVFGQSIGGGIVDAYTARKALPRVLIAAILINISFFGVALLVDIFNVLGNGVAQLITAPLEGNGSFNYTPNNFVNASGLLAIGLGGTWLIGLLTSASFLAIVFMSVVLPMFIIILTIFGTIIIRRGLIIVLAVLAPIAAVMFVLPGTEKYARQWFDLFLKTLLVYPIIMIIFGVADLLSVMFLNASSNVSGVQDTLQQFVGLIILFIPFFLIPFAFRFAGSAIQTIANGISNTTRKRLEAYKGSEFDRNSRISQARDAWNETRGKRKEARSAWLADRSGFRLRFPRWRGGGGASGGPFPPPSGGPVPGAPPPQGGAGGGGSGPTGSGPSGSGGGPGRGPSGTSPPTGGAGGGGSGPTGSGPSGSGGPLPPPTPGSVSSPGPVVSGAPTPIVSTAPPPSEELTPGENLNEDLRNLPTPGVPIKNPSQTSSTQSGARPEGAGTRRPWTPEQAEKLQNRPNPSAKVSASRSSSTPQTPLPPPTTTDEHSTVSKQQNDIDEAARRRSGIPPPPPPSSKGSVTDREERFGDNN